ncbi:MAG: transglutaminase [Betaproteobacteria bacterium]|jgi:transglutaminase-like putative cysteine protease|nr:transglutaminase [Betaproteobacteria bacterium]
MRLSIDHVTHYRYERPVRYSTQYLRLVPQSSARQRVLEWRLDTPSTPLELRDGYGNILHVLTIDKPVSEIVIRSSGAVETSTVVDEPNDEPKLSPLIFLRQTALTRADEAICQFAERYRRRAGMLSGLRDLASGVLAKLPFQPGVTAVQSTAAEAFEHANGVCQDHAHVFIACCRHLGIPARYVSGYIYSAGHAEAAVASHAWVEAWVVDRWRSFDITNARPAGEHHIRLAFGADYLEASPVRGVRSGGGEEHLTATALVGSE